MFKKLFFFVFVALLFSFSFSAHAADRYWVGGTASWDGTAGTKWAATSGGGGGQAIPTTSDTCYFDASSSGVVTVAAGNTGCGDIDFTGFTGTLAGSASLTIAGSLTLDDTMTNSYTGALTFSSTGSETITSDGVALDSNVTFNGVSGVFALADAFETGSTRTVTLTNGTFDANDQNFTAGFFNSSNSNTRTVTMGDGVWSLSAVDGNLLNLSTDTNLTFTAGANPIRFTGDSASGQNRYWLVTLEEDSPALSVMDGAGNIRINGGSTVGDLYFDPEFAGAFAFTSSAGAHIYGDLTLSPNMSMFWGTNCVCVFGSGATTTITTNGVDMHSYFQIGQPGESDRVFVLQDDIYSSGWLYMGFVAGTFDANGNDITIDETQWGPDYSGAFQSNAGLISLGALENDSRTILMGEGTWNVPAFLTTTGFVEVNPETSTLILNGTTPLIEGSNTLYNFTVEALASTTPYANEGYGNRDTLTTLTFGSSSQQTIQGTLTLKGVDANERLELRSDASGTQWQINPQGRRVIDYVDFKDSYNISYEEILYDDDSLDSGNNRGWRYDQVTEAGPSGSAGGGGLSSSSKSRQSSNSSPSNIIQQIQDRIAELRRQLHELQGEGASDFALYRTLLRGMQGEDVRYLQTLLNKLGFPVASSGPGSTGNETSLFGQLTHDAVVKLQAAHIAEILTPAGLSAPTGIVGPATRAWLQNNQ